MDVAVTRKFLKKDYFQQNTGGYFGGPSTSGGRWIDAVRLSSLTDRLVTYSFLKPFKELPISYIDVHRFELNENGDFIKQNVLCVFPLNPLPLKQIIIKIDPIEPLEGIIINMIFT